MNLSVSRHVSKAFIALALLASACKPEYPKCESDDHCKEKGEVCINQSCQECGDDTHCEAKYPGEARECVGGRCEVKPECRIDGDCAAKGAGLVCRANACVPECTADADCAAGSMCQDSKCVPVVDCTDDIMCGPGRHCENGKCADGAAGATNISANCRPMDAQSGAIVALENVSFDFDRFELDMQAQEALRQNVECLKQAPQVQVVVEGHCDDRGTQEYNLALGEKRANTVISFMGNLGIETSRMRPRSKGENEPLCTSADEACWAKNRRVQFIQRMK